jgi:hypothetical protein
VGSFLPIPSPIATKRIFPCLVSAIALTQPQLNRFPFLLNPYSPLVLINSDYETFSSLVFPRLSQLLFNH